MIAKMLPNRRRRMLQAGLLLLALLAGGHAVLWHWLAGRLQREFTAWAALQRTQGWDIAHGEPERGGWPLAVTLRLPGFSAAGAEALLPGGFTWQAEALQLRIAAPRLDQLEVAAIGQQRLASPLQDLPFIADRLVASLPLAPESNGQPAVLHAENLRLGAGSDTVSLRRARASILAGTGQDRAPLLQLEAVGEAISLPASPATAGLTAALGNALQSASLRASLAGPLPPLPAPARRVAAWRDAGGSLAVQELALAWGPAQAQASASLRLDAALQPAGSGTLRLTGAEPLLEAAAAAGLLPPRNLGALRTVLRLMQRPGTDGRPVLELPVTLADRNLGVARMTLLRLPPVSWAD